MADDGRAGHDYLNHIKTKNDVWHIEHSQPCHGSPKNQAAFFSVHGIQRACEILGRSRLDLDKDEFVVTLVPADDIDFASVRSTKVPEENLVTVVSQVSGCQLLTSAPKSEMGRVLRRKHGSDVVCDLRK